jgi:hypothetical protein
LYFSDILSLFLHALLSIALLYVVSSLLSILLFTGPDGESF